MFPERMPAHRKSSGGAFVLIEFPNAHFILNVLSMIVSSFRFSAQGNRMSPTRVPSRGFYGIAKLFLFALIVSLCAQSNPIGICGEPKGPLIGFATPRTWSDASGKFRIEANLKNATETEVQLLKSDGKIVTVPVDKLSPSDQAFIDGFLKAEAALMAAGKLNDSPAEEENPFAGGEPSGDRGGTMKASAAPTGGIISGGELPKREAIIKGVRPLSITPSKAFWSATPPVGFPEVTFEDIITKSELTKPFFASMKVLAAGKSGNIVLNSYQQGRGEKDNYSKFVVLQGSTGDSSGVTEFSEPWKLMAISPDGGRLAAVRVIGFDKGNDLAIMRITPEGVVPEFQFTAGGGSWDELQFVAFAPGNRLVTISQKHNLVFWDLENSQGPRAIRSGNSGGTHKASLSPAGELMALNLGPAVAVIETVSGKLVGCIVREQAVSNVVFSPDGTSILVYQPFGISVYSTADGSEIHSMAVSESNPDAPVSWLGKNVMVGAIVYDVQRGVPMWTYNGNPASRATLGNYLISAFGGDKESTAALFRIPHDEAIRASQTIDPNSIYAIVPGDNVAVNFQISGVPANTQQEIRSAVEKKIRSLGWQISSSAQHTILVEVTQGKQEEAEYYTRSGFGPIFAPIGFGAPSGTPEKVQYTPWTHKISIATSGTPVFSTQAMSTAPMNLQTRDGESTQAAVSRICQPTAAFFERMAIPPSLLKAEYQGGLGKSTIDASGMH